MAGALVSIILAQLTSIGSKQIEEKVQLVVGVEDEVQKLKRNFRAIQAVLEDAEKRQFNEAAVRLWFDELKDACYDIHDVLDEWSTAILKHQIQRADDNSPPPNKKVRFSQLISSVFSSVLRPIKQGILRIDIATKIKELNERLDVIAKERETYRFELKSSEKEPERQISTSLIDVSEVKGRASDKNVIIDQLFRESNPEEKGFHVISIVGLGGIGKTTLAQLVYNDDKVNTHFKKKIWVCVSDPFDEVKIAKSILQKLQGASPATTDLNDMHEEINNLVREKKFLLVLDDVWTEDTSKWDRLKLSLMYGAKGSKVLVTTRSERVARLMYTTHTHNLKKLSESDCWSLFEHIAFSGRSMGERENLEEIGRKLAEKCDGLALAAKTLGSLMRLKDTKEEWQAILDSEVWKLDEVVKKNLFAPLLLSYYDLPPTMKRLFSYCAVFPKDWWIQKDDLVQLWMAQGYLDSEENSKMEIKGREYFKNLAMRSFFQDFKMDEVDGSILRCKMHDIVHDLAQVLTQNECIVMENDNANKQGSIRARHASITGRLSSSLSFPNTKYLRTILFLSQQDDLGFIDLCNSLSCLRALHMRGCSPREIPREVGKLIHLRYLNLSGTRDLKELPEEVCELCNLQTLNLAHCSLTRLPQEIGKLIYLRYLNLSDNDFLEEFPEEVCELCNLQTLKLVRCSLKRLPQRIGKLIYLRYLNLSYNKDLKELPEDVCELCNLQTLNLAFCSLERLPQGIGKLIYLRYLNLSFNKYLKELPEEMCELCNLQTLNLAHCSLTRLPQEIGKLIYLRYLNLSYNQYLKELPEKVCELCNLQTLNLNTCRSIERLPQGIEKLISLRHLEIECTRSLEVLPKGIGRLGCLRTLSKFIVSDDCKIGELRSLNHLQGNLEIKWLEKVTDVNEVEKAELKNKKELRELTLNFDDRLNFNNEMDYEALEVLQPPSQLESLSIERYGATTLSTNCITFSSNLKFLHLEDFQNCECLLHLGRLSSLEKLTIIRMHSVKRVGVEFLVFEKQERPFISFPKLKELVFKEMWEWEEWEWITITSADKKDEIPIIMPYLRSLELYKCPKLKALPDHFLQNRSFEKVIINECPFVEEQLREMGVEYSSDRYA